MAAIVTVSGVGAAAPAPSVVRAVIPAPAGMENHGAAIAQTRSGALLACWYSGVHEEDRSVRILCARGSRDGARWSRPWTAVAPGEKAFGAAAPNKSLGNVTLTAASDGRIWMIYGVIQSRVWPIVGEVCRNWICGRIDARYSTNEGAAWSPAHRLVDVGGALPRAELKPYGNDWLAPFYLETAQRSVIARLDLAGPAPRIRSSWALTGWKLIQPALVRQADGRFRVYFRDQQRRGVYTARFDPRSGAWSGVQRTNLPNPGAAVDAFTDGAGRYLLIYNPSGARRDLLQIARSDDGVRFAPGCRLSAPGDAGAAYPSIIRSRDGGWRAVYSANSQSGISFVGFNPSWLENCFLR